MAIQQKISGITELCYLYKDILMWFGYLTKISGIRELYYLHRETE